MKSIRTTKVLSILLVLCGLMSACKPQKIIDTDFLRSIHYSDVRDVNQSIGIDLNKDDTVENGLYYFRIMHQSEFDIIMPPDFNVHIFVLNEGDSKWVEIKNNIKYDDNYRVLTQELRKLPITLVVNPVVPFSSHPQKLRIVVSGNVLSNGKETDQIVLAYSEIVYRY